MPDPALIQKLDTLLSQVVDTNMRRYLEEAQRCFLADAYNAAVIMAWCSVALYFRKIGQRFGFDYLVYHLWDYQTGPEAKKKPENEFNHWKAPIIENGLQGLNDQKLLEICQKLGVNIPTEVIGRFRRRRNAFAHPDLEFATQEEAMELIILGQDIYRRTTEAEFGTSLPDIFRYASLTTDRKGVEQICLYLRVSPDDILNYAHKTLDVFVGNKRDDEEISIEGLTGLWVSLWGQLDERRQKTLWKHLVQKVNDILAEYSYRTPEEIANFIVWPPANQPHPARDRIGELYLEWLKQRLDDDTINEESDIKLAKQLRKHLPGHLREQLRDVIQDITTMIKRRFDEDQS